VYMATAPVVLDGAGGTGAGCGVIVDDQLAGELLDATLLHEVGHALGLSHDAPCMQTLRTRRCLERRARRLRHQAHRAGRPHMAVRTGRLP
jgi:hypothetical protein